jgi:signal transduction histidine kinase
MDEDSQAKPERRWIAPVLALTALAALAVAIFRAGSDGLAVFAGLAAAAAVAGLFLFGREAQRRLTEQIDRLKAHNATLSRELDEQQVFLQAASHDLHEPLRKIQAFGERLRDRMGIMPDERSLQYLDRMTDGATRMRSLLDALLVHVRVSDRNTCREMVDLDGVVAHVLADLEDAMRDSGADIETDRLGTVEADERQMRIVFANLVGNALKYRRPGANVAMRISGRTEQGSEGERVVVEVSDNGIGFDPRHAERIFGLFERLHSRSEYEGAGIGLATCRKIVERHGGRISARGNAGQGACFTLILPRQQANLPDKRP